MKVLSGLLVVLALLGQSTPKLKQSSPKQPKAERYDPDKLPPSEIACGRIGAKNAAPCKCRETRETKRNAAHEACRQIEDRKKRIECHASVPACPTVTDRDNHEPGMPVECSRWCSRARCECCHT